MNNEIELLYPSDSHPIYISLKKKNLSETDDLFTYLSFFKDSLMKLDLSSNSIKSLPDLSVFNCLKFLDLTNNPIDLEKILGSLVSCKSLVDLKINLNSQSDVYLVLANLPNLIFLNGKPTKDDFVDLTDPEVVNISMNNEINDFNTTFNTIHEKLKSVNKNPSKKEFFNEFQEIMKAEIEKINQCVDTSAPNFIYATHVVSSKLKLYKYFTDKFMDYLEVKDAESAKIIRELYIKIKSSTDLLVEIIFTLHPKISERMKAMKGNLEDSVKDLGTLNEEYMALEEKYKELVNERESLLNSYEDEKKFNNERIEQLEKENKTIMEKILKSAKTGTNLRKKDSIKQKEASDIATNSNQSNVQVQNTNHIQMTRPTHTSNITSKNSEGAVTGIAGGFGGNEGKGTKTQENYILINHGNETRIFTKKALLEIIGDIYDSKRSFDLKCIENKMPNETLEQYMYSYLNNKYGLKTLVIEWANAIINGVKAFSSEDSEVLLFGKILKNEIEENLKNILDKLSQTITQFLEVYLKNKGTYKTREDIKDQLKSKLNGITSVTEDEWKGIIYYIYEAEDAAFIEGKIVEFIRKKAQDLKSKDSSANKLSREVFYKASKQTKEELKISFKDFQKLLYDFQIKSREKFIKNFTEIFKSIDEDNNGIISEEEFIKLTVSLNIFHENATTHIMRLLNTVDPFNNKQITFSDCINLFSSEKIVQEDSNGNRSTISILEKVCLDEISNNYN